MNDIQVRYSDKSLYCPYGTIADTVLDELSIDRAAITALKVNNEIRPLKTRLKMNSVLEPVLPNSPEGAMIYRRSLAFLLALAARSLFPSRRLYIGHSLGNSYYYTINSEDMLREDEIAALQEEMKSLIKKDLPITFKSLAYEEALEVFSANQQTDTVLLLDQRSTSSIKVNECSGFLDIYVEPLVPRTGLLSSFELMPYQEGFLLRFPAVGSDKSIEPYEDQPNLFAVYHEYKQWGRMVGVRVVGDLNAMIANRTIRNYIRVAEAHQARKIAQVAEKIYDSKDIKMVLLAGPSSSGKTTSAKKLSIELMVLGINPLAISLDDFFVGTEKTPKDEKGEPDYECLEALNIELLNDLLQALYRGEEVTLPFYDFKTGTSRENGGKKIRLEANTVLIVEGIHALNDALTPSIARNTKFKLYVSALTQLNLDDHNRIPTSDNRLLRRMVRDYQFRAKDAAATIKMWPSVQAGERKHIFPFQSNADAALNSALDYELSVLKYYADPLLRAVKPGKREYAEAVRLLSFLENFAPIPPQYVPGTSILREFIGDSEFKY